MTTIYVDNIAQVVNAQRLANGAVRYTVPGAQARIDGPDPCRPLFGLDSGKGRRRPTQRPDQYTP